MRTNLPNNALPGYFYPRRRDSHLDSVGPDKSFIDFFKQSLIHTGQYCTSEDCCSLFDPEALEHQGEAGGVSEITVDSYQRSTPELPYPLSLFEKLTDLPPVSVLREFARISQREYVTSVPFLSNVTCIAREQNDVSFFVLLCQALIGSCSPNQQQSQEIVDILWRASTAIVTGSVEVDNSLGRTIPWHASAILLVSFGCMHADDRNIRRQTDIINGYIQSTLYRSDLLTDSSTRGAGSEISALRSFHFLIDTIRSIQFHTPPQVEPGWTCLIGPTAEYDFRVLYNAMLREKQALPQNLSTDDYLLVLIGILSDINILLCAVGPFTSMYRSVLRGAESSRSTSQGLPAGSINRSLLETYNPHVPFTADYEYRRTKSQLAQSLVTWESSFRSRQDGIRSDIAEDNSTSTVWPLFYFCSLLIESGPTIFLLPSLAGYGAEANKMGFSKQHSGPQMGQLSMNFGTTSFEAALKILECVQASKNDEPIDTTMSNTDGDLQQPCRPIWYPLALFYGALLVWGRMLEDQRAIQHTQTASGILLTSRGFLRMFQAELKELKDHKHCAELMAHTIGKLL